MHNQRVGVSVSLYMRAERFIISDLYLCRKWPVKIEFIYLGDGEELGDVEEAGQDDGRYAVLQEQERLPLAPQPETQLERGG
jgi:hypothetical protein